MSESLVRSSSFKPRDHRNVLVAILQGGDRRAAQRAGRGVGHVEIGDAREVGAVGIDVQLDLEAFLLPLIAHAGEPRRPSSQCSTTWMAMRRISAMSCALCLVLTSAWLTTRISTG